MGHGFGWSRSTSPVTITWDPGQITTSRTTVALPVKWEYTLCHRSVLKWYRKDETYFFWNYRTSSSSCMPRKFYSKFCGSQMPKKGNSLSLTGFLLLAQRRDTGALSAKFHHRGRREMLLVSWVTCEHGRGWTLLFLFSGLSLEEWR